MEKKKGQRFKLVNSRYAELDAKKHTVCVQVGKV
jgi:hypothetical protein